jgi:hypothetical protein
VFDDIQRIRSDGTCRTENDHPTEIRSGSGRTHVDGWK